MKKFVSIALVAMMIMSALVFTACGGGDVDLSDSKYVGTWKAVELSLGDDTGELEVEYILTLNGDGTGSFDGDDGLINITWELTNEGFKTKGDTKLKFRDDGDRIVTTILGVDMAFERQ